MPAVATRTRRFHFGLKVADLDRAVSFYRILFGVDPVKRVDDYVKFEVADPPLVLALHPGGGVNGGGALNHVGFRVADSDALVAVQRRLEEHGIPTQREEGVECCYALQTKFWVPDADGHLWEVYTLHQDLDHSGFGGDDGKMPPRPSTVPPVVWEHLVSQPAPEQIPHADDSVDEVRLTGTFNSGFDRAARRRIIVEAFRVLRPAGTLRVHGLVGDKPFPGRPNLPGPAAQVREVPVETEPLAELTAAGFVGLSCDKLGDIHCFRVGGVELRELQLTATKPVSGNGAAAYRVLYRGPLARVTDERGRTFERGRRVPVDESTWRLFQEPPFAQHFTCFRCSTDNAHSGSSQ